MEIFATDKLRHLRNRAAISAQNHEHFLLTYLNEIISDKFTIFSKKFNKILLIGAISPEFYKLLKEKLSTDIIVVDIAEELLKDKNYTQHQLLQSEIPELSNNSFDLIYSYLDLHHINNVPNYLISCRKMLKQDGCFMASFFGGTSLTELRQATLKAETELGGATMRVFPFIDVKTAGMLMQKAGFHDVAADSDLLNISYKNIKNLYHDLKDIAETNILTQTHQYLMSKKRLNKISETYQSLYQEDNHTKATFEFIHLMALTSSRVQER